MADDLADDDGHPIAKVGVIDAVVTLRGGGAYYALVIPRPIAADTRSKNRLSTKIERYLNSFYSPESAATQGTPKAGKMRIYVNMHKDSDPEMFEEVKRHEPWVRENGIELIVHAIDDNGDRCT